MATYTIETLAKFLDHTNLKANATHQDIEKLCNEAKTHAFKTACVNQVQTPLAAKFLKDSGIGVCVTVGFPLGQTSIAAKVFETKEAIANGANEIDYVINVSEAKAGNWAYLQDEMEQIVKACNDGGAGSKVIFENAYLTKEEIKKLSEIASVVRPTFIKTSTGMAPTGATEEDIKIMSQNGGGVGVKSSGGIRDAAIFLKMIKAGATRVGASASIEIIEGLKKEFPSGEVTL